LDDETRELLLRAAAVRPSLRQLAWQQMECYAFVHFGMNTFTGREWGEGTEDPACFNPTAFDADQWVRVVRDAGMTGLILTAKHHDGFCLWPSAYTGHSVKHSPWRNGQGDVVAEVARACQAGGIRFGIYLSPWDRHEPAYGDSPRYNAHYRNQLRELLTDYGDVFTVWLDGACGEGPNGKRQEYDWQSYFSLVRELQPRAVIFGCGPDVRWCGNEAGRCRASEWSVVPAELLVSEGRPDAGPRLCATDADLGSREVIARYDHLVWYPAEVDTSIRPGWFYHAEEDGRIRPLDELLDIYYGAVGGNACLLLNFPPDRRGLIHEHDAKRAREFGAALHTTFATDLVRGAMVTASHTRVSDGDFRPAYALDGCLDTCWMTEDWQDRATLEFALPEPRTFNVAMVQERIALGQRIERFRLSARVAGAWRPLAEATTVGYKRLLRFAPVTTDRVRLDILASRVCPTVSNFGLYRDVSG
jgi:alpha-L-fucosidase